MRWSAPTAAIVLFLCNSVPTIRQRGLKLKCNKTMKEKSRFLLLLQCKMVNTWNFFLEICFRISQRSFRYAYFWIPSFFSPAFSTFSTFSSFSVYMSSFSFLPSLHFLPFSVSPKKRRIYQLQIAMQDVTNFFPMKT